MKKNIFNTTVPLDYHGDRIDKPRNFKIIENGGWHFAFLQNPRNISNKI